MRKIQEETGLDKPIEPQENYVRAQFIEQRIDELLKDENFIFFKIFKASDKDFVLKNAIELQEIKRLVDTLSTLGKFYMKQGQIEPLYITEEERKLLTKGMEQSIQKIQLEIFKSIQNTQQITGEPSESLVNRLRQIEALQKKFGAYLSERPFIFQKFSFHGLVLAKEILSKARDEVNQMCMEDLSNEIKAKQAKIDEFTRVNG